MSQQVHYFVSIPSNPKFQQKRECVRGIPSILDKKAFIDFSFYH